MHCSIPLAALLLTLTACGDKADDGDDTGGQENETEPEISRVPRLEGAWNVSEGAWTADQCNGPATILPPETLELTDSLPNSFTIALFIGNTQLIEAPVECTVQDDDSFLCVDFTSGWDLEGLDAAVDLVGTVTMTFSSETEMNGSADMILTCTGADCEDAGASVGVTENPCTTNYTWTGTHAGE